MNAVSVISDWLTTISIRVASSTSYRLIEGKVVSNRFTGYGIIRGCHIRFDAEIDESSWKVDWSLLFFIYSNQLIL